MKDEMGLIFRKEHIRLILEGAKMQTCRRHKRPPKQGKVYDIKRDWFRRTGHLITKVFRQRLGDITPEEAVKEGGYTIKEFQAIGVGYTVHGTPLRGRSVRVPSLRWT